MLLEILYSFKLLLIWLCVSFLMYTLHIYLSMLKAQSQCAHVRVPLKMVGKRIAEEHGIGSVLHRLEGHLIPGTEEAARFTTHLVIST